MCSKGAKVSRVVDKNKGEHGTGGLEVDISVYRAAINRTVTSRSPSIIVCQSCTTTYCREEVKSSVGDKEDL